MNKIVAAVQRRMISANKEVSYLALDSIKAISEAEEAARNTVNDATRKAQEMISEQIRTCEAELTESIAAAEVDAARIISESQAAAEVKANELWQSTANKCAIMAVRAEGKFDEAIRLIIGKVVRG